MSGKEISGLGAMTPDRSEGADWLAEAYDLHARRLHRYLSSVVGDAAAAEDILQEVFCKLASRGSFVEVSNPEKYLFRAAHNEAMRWLRNSRRARAGALDRQSVTAPPARRDDAITDGAVERAIAELPPEQAEVVHLKVYERMTFERIGELLGCPANTAASRYRYACMKLRSLLGDVSDE